MKAITLLLIIVSISVMQSSLSGYGFTNKWCTDYENKYDEEHQAFSKDFCSTLAVEDPENKCCYIKFEKSNGTFYNCVELTLNQFYHIKEIKTSFQNTEGAKVKSIECESSSYLYGSLLLILALLF